MTSSRRSSAGRAALAVTVRRPAPPAALGRACSRSSTTTWPHARLARSRARALRRCLLEAVRPGDRVTILAPDQDVWWSARLDEERSDLLAVADRLQGRRKRGNSEMDYQAMLVHQRGDEGFLSRYTPEAVKARATAEAQQAQDNAERQQQMREGGGRILAPASTIGGPPIPTCVAWRTPCASRRRRATTRTPSAGTGPRSARCGS